MPDQSLQPESSPEAAAAHQEPSSPADVSGNDPAQAQESAVLANAPLASEGQKQQADVTINQDPTIAGDSGATTSDAGSTPGDDYDDEDAWSYRQLQAHAKELDVKASGERDEIVARIRESEAQAGTESVQESPSTDPESDVVEGDSAPTDDVPTADVPANQVVNGGIALDVERTTEHAQVLQGLSAERRSQQLAAAHERASNSSES